MGKPMTCRLGWHKWIRRSTEDGQRYLRCGGCDKENPQSSLPPNAGIGI